MVYEASLILEWYICWHNQIMEKRNREKVIYIRCYKISFKDMAKPVDKIPW